MNEIIEMFNVENFSELKDKINTQSEYKKIKDLAREYSDCDDMHLKDILHDRLDNLLYKYFLNALKDGISYEELYEMIMYEDTILLAKEHEKLSDEPDINILEKPTVIDTHSNCKVFLDVLTEARENLKILSKKEIKSCPKDDTFYEIYKEKEEAKKYFME